MHPAYSIIFFTTASGFGYGMLFLLGLAAAAGLLPPDRWLGAVGLGVALAAVGAGLLSSTFHLGHPERAWRAVSQWRSSWLSREGVMALVTFLPAGVFAVGWVLFGRTGGAWAVAGLLTAAGALLTVYCTAMIYASIRAVPRWHTGMVPATYLTLALMTGATGLYALLRLFGDERPEAAILAAVAIALASLAKVTYWARIDAAPPVATSGSATGLAAGPGVRLLDAPHTSDTYLQKEMGYRVARKHARKLRRIALVAAFGAPLLFTLLSVLTAGPVGALLALLAAASALLGTAIERWLFFAEAKHAVTLYYGEASV